MPGWVSRLRHDLVKRVLWTARDLRSSGLTAGPADLAALRRDLTELTDAEGAPATALEVWAALREQAPPGSDPVALDDFETALRRAEQAVRDRPDEALAAVLALEPAYIALARALEGR